MKNIFFCLIVAFATLSGFAYEPNDSAVVYFRIGHRQFDPALNDNRASMNHFLERVKIAKETNNIDYITVRAYASPDGEYAANQRLTGYRCQELASYIVQHAGISGGLIREYPEGIAWAELRRQVAANPDVPARDKVLYILDNTPVWVYDEQGRIVDSRKKQLQDLDGGRPYRWMFEHIFPTLRNAVAATLYLKSDAQAAGMNAHADSIETRLNTADERLAAAESRLAAAQARLEAAGGRAAEEGRKAVAAGLAATAEGRKAVAEGKQAAADGLTAVSEGREATEEGRVAAAEGRTAVAKGRQAVAQGRLAEAEALAATAEACADKAESHLRFAEDKAAVAESDQTSETPSEAEASALTAGVDFTPIHRFALKTNLLYDVLLMPNLELQWRINPLWSVALEANVAWWKNDAKHKYYQIMMFSPEVRRFVIPRGEWHGMYVGAFVGGGKYDLENGGTGYKGEGGMAGLSVGYMWPVSRTLSLEAGLGLGYMYTRYKEYVPHDGHYLYQRTKNMNYFGPLKVKFALAWRFDVINKPSKVNPAL